MQPEDGSAARLQVIRIYIYIPGRHVIFSPFVITLTSSNTNSNPIQMYKQYMK